MYGDQAMLLIEPYTTFQQTSTSSGILHKTPPLILMQIKAVQCKDALNSLETRSNKEF